jgi:hypothetical protein
MKINELVGEFGIWTTGEEAELLKKLNELQKLHNEGTALYTMRVSKKQAKYFKGLDEQHHYGNPFTGTKVKGQIPMNGITAAVNAYEDWLNGQDYFTDKNGVEYDLLWVCFQDETRECWTWSNKEIKIQSNISLGRLGNQLLNLIPHEPHSKAFALP